MLTAALPEVGVLMLADQCWDRRLLEQVCWAAAAQLAQPSGCSEP